MENLNIDLNLLKLSRAAVASIHNVRCVIIPCEENDIFVSQDQQTGQAKGAYMHLSAWANKNGVSQYGDTHYVKQSFSQEFRQKYPEASNNAPILGNAKPIQIQGSAANNVVAPTVEVDGNDPLPF